MNFEYQNILVRMPNWIGDAVMATPILADLRRRWPHANLTAMCQGGVGQLLIGNPNVNEIFSFSRPNEFLRRQQTRDLILRMKQGKYDLGILLTHSFSSAWWLWRGDIPKRIGYAKDSRRLLLTDAIPYPKDVGKEHLVITYKKLLEPLGIPQSVTGPQLFVTEEEKKAATLLLEQLRIPKNSQIIGVNPTAAFGPAKCWPPDRFRAVAEKLIQHPDLYVLFFGDATGAPIVHSICRDLSPRVIDLAGLTNLRELIALIEQCSLFLTNDSGPMHIAAALQVPLIALFGSTNPIATGPYQHGTILRKEGISCSPCLKRVCPIDFRCMLQIEVEEVYQAILKHLGRKN